MKEVIECAYCDGTAQLHKEERELKYRKEDFKVVQHFYKCEQCDEEFTNNEVDALTLVQAHNQYREKHSIPFPHEIINLKNKYGLTASKMGEILGLGQNSFTKYEKGEMPISSMGKLLKMAANPDIFLTLIEDSKETFKPKAYEELKARVELLAKKENEQSPYYCDLDRFDTPSAYNGFRTTSAEKLSNVVIAFLIECDSLYNDKLKLNKLLFYLDFCHYRYYGYSITGTSYRAIKYGPVPSNYDNIYTYLENEKVIISKFIKDEKGGAREVFETNSSLDEVIFNEEELSSLKYVISKFKDTPTWDIVDLSHEEDAWKDLNRDKELISYQDYAFGLKTI